MKAWGWAARFSYPVGMILNIQPGHGFVMSTGGYANGGKYTCDQGHVMIIVIFYGTWY